MKIKYESNLYIKYFLILQFSLYLSLFLVLFLYLIFFYLVRSYGTEDRETNMPIAPQNQVYDYILFRGSDIKDIRVVNNVPQVPNDPAIMQMQLPNQMGQQNFGPQFPPQFPPGAGHLGGPMNQFAGGNQFNAMSGLSGINVGAAAGQPPAPFGQPGQQNNKSKQASELNNGLAPENHPSPAVEHREQGARHSYTSKFNVEQLIMIEPTTMMLGIHLMYHYILHLSQIFFNFFFLILFDWFFLKHSVMSVRWFDPKTNLPYIHTNPSFYFIIVYTYIWLWLYFVHINPNWIANPIIFQHQIIFIPTNNIVFT